MLYLVYNTTEEAINRTAEIALDLGCDPRTTKFWYSWMVHPTLAPLTALEIPDLQAKYLTPSEQSSLLTQREMEDDGWFDHS